MRVLAALSIVCGFVIAAGNCARADERATKPARPAIAAGGVDFAPGDLLLAWDDDPPPEVEPRDPPPPRDRPRRPPADNDLIPGDGRPPLGGPRPPPPTFEGPAGGRFGGEAPGQGLRPQGKGGMGMKMGGVMDRLAPSTFRADPEVMKLDQADREAEQLTRDLAGQFRHTSSEDDKKRILNNLADVVEKHFQVRQERRQLELKRLEKQLDHLRGVIEKRTAGKDAIIKGRMTQLLGEQDDLSF